MKAIRPDHQSVVRRAKLNNVEPGKVKSVRLTHVGEFNATFEALSTEGEVLFHGMLPLDILSEIET